MRSSKLFLTAALLASLAAPALAQRGPPMTPEERAAAFDKADVNKDGKLDKAEFKATLPEAMQGNADMVFDRRDTDKDGFISKAEFMAAGGRRGGGGAPPAGQ